MSFLSVLTSTPIPLPNNFCLHQKSTKTILVPIIIWSSHEQKELENNSIAYVIFGRTLPSKGPPWVHVEQFQAKPQITKKTFSSFMYNKNNRTRNPIPCSNT